jgi:hypothetical protein
MYRYTLFFVCLSGVIACNTPQKPSEMAGTWVVSEAYRNGKPAEAMSGIFFTLSADGKLSTNFSATGDTLNGTWEADTEALIVRTDDPADFEITQQSDSLIRIRTDWHGFNISLICQR